MSGLEGEVAVVFGSTRGIGRGIAERLAADGAGVVITGRSDADGKDVEEAIRTAGGQAVFQRTDVGNEPDVAAAIDVAVQTYGRLTAVVNVAAAMELTFGGDGLADKAVDQLENEAWEKMLRNSLTYVFWSAKYAVPRMRQAGHGSIVNISSAASLQGIGGHPAYCAAKSGMNGLTRAVADAYGPENIRCNAVVLGLVASSPEVGGMLTALGPKLNKVQMLAGPASVAQAVGAVAFLVGPDSGSITGALIPVDSGMTNKLNVIDPHDIAEIIGQQRAAN